MRGVPVSRCTSVDSTPYAELRGRPSQDEAISAPTATAAQNVRVPLRLTWPRWSTTLIP